jgi:hypothetical protein
VSQTLPALSDIVYTAEDVDFAVGDSVVVTSSEVPTLDDPDQAEQVTVVEVLSDRSFRVSPPFRYTHRSEWYQAVAGFAPVDMRVEVGLLTRNVVIQGDDDHSDLQVP